MAESLLHFSWKVKEHLGWIRLTKTAQMAIRRITRFIGYVLVLIGDNPLLEPVRKALATLKIHAKPFVRHWTSSYTNTRGSIERPVPGRQSKNLGLPK